MSKFSFSPSVKKYKSKENTPVKGMDDAVKRIKQARAENEWKKNMMERGTPIKGKDKENFMKKSEITEIKIKLQNGETEILTYHKGESLNYLVNEFCVKHKITPDYHQTVKKTVIKALKSVGS
jgi:hypothetical protein